MTYDLYNRRMIAKLCSRFLDDFMIGKFGLSGIVTHPQYLQISKTMRRQIAERDLPLDVLGNHGRVEVFIDQSRLSPRELSLYKQANRKRVELILYGEDDTSQWPLTALDE